MDTGAAKPKCHIMPLLPKDDFTLWLEAHGTQPTLYQPAARYGGAPVGWKIYIGQSSFVYRLPEDKPGVLLIVLFERLGDRKGLRSPFADFVRFISSVKRSGVPIHTIEGHVEALKGRPEDSLADEQIVTFYKRYLAANQLRVENGIEWVAGNLLTYVAPLSGVRKEDDPPAPGPRAS